MSDNLKPGDLLEIKRKLGYSHWALYIGNDEVIHLTIPADNACSCVSFCFHKGIVKKSGFREVTDGYEWSINNSKDKQFKALPVDQVIQKGKSLLDQRVYNILFFNCEHFCSYCRYGVKQSDQVDNATFIFVNLLAFCVYFASELCKKENNAIRDDSCRKQNSPTFETTGHADVVGKCCQVLGDLTKMLTSWERTGELVSFGGRCIELFLEALKNIDFLKHLPRILNELHTGNIQEWISDAAVQACSTPPSLPTVLHAYGRCSMLCFFLGFGLQMFGCVLKRFTAEIGDKMDKIGCTVKKWGRKEITDTIVSIYGWALVACGKKDLTLEGKKKLAALVDCVLLVLNMQPQNLQQLIPFLVDVFFLVRKHRDVMIPNLSPI